MPQDWRRKLVARWKLWALERWPLQFPVRVYIRSPKQMDGQLGYFTMDDDLERGTIAVRSDLEHYVLLDTLCEEWSHARVVWLNDEEDHSDDPYHHATFWAEYGRIQHSSRSVEW
jgi:hypothetical protein